MTTRGHSLMDEVSAENGSGKDDANPEDDTPSEEILTDVPLSEIVVDADLEGFSNARLPENERKGIEELAENIRKTGLLQTVVCSRERDGKLHLRAGFRRYRALELLGRSATVKVLPPMSLKEQLFANAAENSQRENLTDYELAARADFMERKFQVTGSEFARRVGRSASYINNLVRWIRNLPAEILTDWRAGHPALGLREIEKLSHLQEDEAVAAWISWSGKSPFGPGGEDGADGEEEGLGEPKKKPARPPNAAMLGILHDAILEADLSDRERKIALDVVKFAMGWRKSVPGVYEPSWKTKRKPGRKKKRGRKPKKP